MTPVSYTHLDVYKRQVLHFVTLQVGAKFLYDFLTKCITNVENSNVHRKQEVVAYLRKRQHGVATVLGLRNARSPVPPQRTSSSPTVARCNSALAVSYTHLDVYKRQLLYHTVRSSVLYM